MILCNARRSFIQVSLPAVLFAAAVVMHAAAADTPPPKVSAKALTAAFTKNAAAAAKKYGDAMNPKELIVEGVVAAETVLSHADGERGIILVRGRTIGDLVALGYEGAIALLWDGFAGEKPTRAAITDALGAGRALAFSRLDEWLPTASRREGARVRPCRCRPRPLARLRRSPRLLRATCCRTQVLTRSLLSATSIPTLQSAELRRPAKKARCRSAA